MSDPTLAPELTPDERDLIVEDLIKTQRVKMSGGAYKASVPPIHTPNQSQTLFTSKIHANPSSTNRTMGRQQSVHLDVAMQRTESVDLSK